MKNRHRSAWVEFHDGTVRAFVTGYSLTAKKCPDFFEVSYPRLPLGKMVVHALEQIQGQVSEDDFSGMVDAIANALEKK